MSELKRTVCPLLTIAAAARGSKECAMCIEDACAWWSIDHCVISRIDEIVWKEE